MKNLTHKFLIAAALAFTALCVPLANAQFVNLATDAVGRLVLGSPSVGLAQIGANTVLGNSTSTTGDVTAMSMASCSASGNGLIWTTNTGFGCNTGLLYSGGPLGTPSSGTGTNITGIPLGNLVAGTLVTDLLFTDATYDIGKSGATRPRDLFLSRNGTFGGLITGNGGLAFLGGGSAPTGATTGIFGFVSSGLPILTFANSSAPSNKKMFDFFLDGSGIFHGHSVLDSYAGEYDWISVAANGTGSPPVTIPGAFSVTGHTTFEGVTSTGATGTGNLVYSDSPAFTTKATAPNYIASTGGATTGDAATSQKIVKHITGIADNTATAVFTVTVPNSAQSASIVLNGLGVLGAGDAVGAHESAVSILDIVPVTRTAGLATAAVASSIGTAQSSVAGGFGFTTPRFEISSLTGANSATQTFTINIVLFHGGGSSTNHTATVMAEIINEVGSGITIN